MPARKKAQGWGSDSPHVRLEIHLEWRLLGAARPGLVLPALVGLRLLYELLEGQAVLRCSARAGCCAARPPPGVMLGGNIGPKHLYKVTVWLDASPPTSLSDAADDVA